MTRSLAPKILGDSYTWVGASGDPWSSPAAWFNETTGTVGTSRPGARATVLINNATVDGTGSARIVSLQGDDTLNGTFTFGTLEATSGTGEGGPTSLVGNFRIGLLDALSTVSIGGLTGRPSSLDARTVRLASQAAATVENAAVTVSGGILTKGTLMVDSGSVVQASRLYLTDVEVGSGTPTAIVTVDQTSSFEVGTSGKVTKGAITVDSGATISGSGYLDATVIDNGVVAASGGTLYAYQLSGSGEIRIDAHALFQGYLAASLTVRFAGPGAVLGTTGALVSESPQPKLVGFAAGDIIEFFAGYYPSSVSVKQTGGGETVSVLGYGTSEPIATFTLLGSSLPTEFLALTNLNTGSNVTSALIALPSGNGTGSASAGTQSGDLFRWTGTAGPDWSVAGDWVDVTLGGVAAVAPGTLDTVMFSDVGGVPTVVAGVGQAKTMLVDLTSGLLILDGRFDVGTLLLRQGSVDIAGAGCVVTAGVLSSYGGTADVIGISDGASLDAGTINGGNWDLTFGGAVRTGQLNGVLNLGIDITSSFEIGNAGHTALGALTVDSGVTVTSDIIVIGGLPTAPASLIIDGTVTGAIAVSGNLALNGTLEVQGTSDVVGSIKGSGTVVLGTGSEFTAGYSFPDSLTSGVTIDFAGAEAKLDLNQFAQNSSMTLVGFSQGDKIGVGYDSFQFTPHGQDGGTLLIDEFGTSTVLDLQLVGDYAQAQFLSVADLSLNGRRALIVLPGVDGQVAAGPGGPKARLLTWSTPGSTSAWGSAANWTDDANGQAVATAAGHLDTVTIGTSYSPPTVIYGAGDAAALTAYSTVFNGRFATPSATLVNSFVAGFGSSLTTTMSSTDHTTIDAGQLVAASGTVTTDLTVSNGGSVAFGTLTLNSGYIDLDPTSYCYVGSGTPFGAAGVLTVGSGATVSGSGAIGAVLDDGTIAITSLAINGDVSGDGRIDVGAAGSGASLVLESGVSATTEIAFVGNAADLVLNDPAHMAGHVLGLTLGDVIELYGLSTATSAHFQQTSAAGGQLMLEDSKGSVLDSVYLKGSYTAATFAVSVVQATAAVSLTSFHGTA